MEPLANNILLIHEDNERLHARIAQLEKQLSDEQQWRVDAQLYADKLQAEVGELKGLLRECEWADGDYYGFYCTQCCRPPDKGHAPNCRLAAALKD